MIRNVEPHDLTFRGRVVAVLGSMCVYVYNCIQISTYIYIHLLYIYIYIIFIYYWSAKPHLPIWPKDFLHIMTRLIALRFVSTTSVRPWWMKLDVRCLGRNEPWWMEVVIKSWALNFCGWRDDIPIFRLEVYRWTCSITFGGWSG